MEPFIKAAVITSTHGVRGDVKVFSFFTDLKKILSKTKLYLNETEIDLKIKGRINNRDDLFIATIQDVADKNSAEKLAGKELYIKSEFFPKKHRDEYYPKDLINLKVINAASSSLYGYVQDIVNYGSGDLLEIILTDNEGNKTKKVEFYHFTNQIFPEVNLEAGYLTIMPPEFVAV